ncbi:MAG: hypothetical protein HY907_04585 [Deltaproteobacteria bacterium]|nr:hypothetical protein [Deltaproteobacteria bacterium]
MASRSTGLSSRAARIAATVVRRRARAGAGALVLAIVLGCGLNTAGEWPTETGDFSPDGGDGDVVRPDDGGPDREDGEVDRGETLADDAGADGDDEAGDEGSEDVVEEAGPVCGNGLLESGEECDDGPANSDTEPGACRTDCRLFSCGDGVLDPGEACDDGNTLDGDGCEANCTLITCGDGVVQGLEDCDDGNANDTDDCLTTCVAASCGDGFVWAFHEACDLDAPLPCDTTCGTPGEQACVYCAWSSECTPPAESCNGGDDDCDGETDETFACVPGAGQGCTTACGTAGAQSCTAACLWDSCVPPAETCNALDDDCNGETDETFACVTGASRACATSCGSSGTQDCSASCAWGACTPPAEVCNGVDDDCASGCDNGFACCAGTATSCTTTCGTTGSGTCTASCAAPAAAACTPPAEGCYRADDDCDGDTDETFPCVRGDARPCTTTCATTGTENCDATCAWGACAPPAEICNARDDDCDGATEHGFACIPGAGRSCATTCGSTGTQSCSSSCAWSACAAPAETCNGRDDDCDGSTDEGLASCNDACANAIDISAMASVTGTTSGASNDNAVCAGPCGSTTAADVWYRFTLAAQEVVYLSVLGATWDTVLDVRRGSACGSLAPQACMDDSCGTSQSQWAGMLAAGTYYVAIDGCATADAGAFTLTYRHSPCPGALAVAAPGRQTGNSCGDGNDTTSGTSSCGGSNSEEVPYFFALCPGSHTLHADDCDDGAGWNASVYIRRGGGGTCGGTAVDCSGPGGCGLFDPRAWVEATVTGPDLIFVVQDGWSLGGNSCGSYGLDLAW